MNVQTYKLLMLQIFLIIKTIKIDKMIMYILLKIIFLWHYFFAT